MSDYVILTDSTSDLPQTIRNKFNIPMISMELTVNEKIFSDSEVDLDEFYRDLKLTNSFPKTTRINPQRFVDFFSEFLTQDKDILYVCFSSGLSGSYSSAVEAAKEVMNKFPKRKIAVVDSLCASIGEGLLVYEMLKRKNQGYDFNQLVDWANENKLKIDHWFVVDDLEHLKRGGRISKATAVFGNMLNVKPVLRLDDFGKLDVKIKLRGKSKAEEYIISKIGENSKNINKKTIIVGYTDDKSAALKLYDAIQSLYNPEGIFVSRIGAVIGSHVGSGMLAMTFLGDKR